MVFEIGISACAVINTAAQPVPHGFRCSVLPMTPPLQNRRTRLRGDEEPWATRKSRRWSISAAPRVPRRISPSRTAYASCLPHRE